MFAVYDEAKILQYVGFSKGLRDSLRTLFSRRPEKAHSYRWAWRFRSIRTPLVSGPLQVLPLVQYCSAAATAAAAAAASAASQLLKWSCMRSPSLGRALHLPKLDQQQMIDIRAAWFDGNYGPPPGNKRERREGRRCACWAADAGCCGE